MSNDDAMSAPVRNHLTVEVNALGARTGGALRYLQAVIPHFAERPELRATFYVHSDTALLLDSPGSGTNVFPIEVRSPVRRVLTWDQFALPHRAKQRAADVIFSMFNVGPRFPGRPQVVYQHNPWYFTRDIKPPSLSARVDNVARRRLALATCRASSFVLVPSEATKAAIEGWLEPSRPVMVVPHGVDHAFFRRAEGSALPTGLATAGTPRLLYVAHPGAHKGHALLMEAFRQVIKSLPKATLVVTFDAQEPAEHGDTTRAADLIQSVHDLPNIRFVGRQDASAVAALYKWADINLFPSQLESFGLPVLEAMAAGTPTIASRIGPLIEVGGNTAWYHDPRDPRELAQKIIALFHDETERKKLGEEAARRAGTFTWEKHVDSLIGYLDKAASDPKYRLVR